MPSKGNATWSIATAFSGCRISHLHITPPWDTMLPKSNRLDTQIQTPHPYQLLYVQSSKYNVKKNDTKRSSPTKQITAGKQAFYLTFLDVSIWGGRKEQLIIVCLWQENHTNLWKTDVGIILHSDMKESITWLRLFSGMGKLAWWFGKIQASIYFLIITFFSTDHWHFWFEWWPELERINHHKTKFSHSFFFCSEALELSRETSFVWSWCQMMKNKADCKARVPPTFCDAKWPWSVTR